MIVDVHAHCMPAATAVSAPQLAAQIEAGKLSDSTEHIADRLRRMDEAGIERQILMAGMSHYNTDEAACVAATREINDAFAALVHANPTRFSAYLSLPLPHIDAALAELRRWADDKAFVGISGHCSVLNQSIADEHFGPLFEAFDKAGSVVFLHPVVNGVCSAFINDWGLSASFGTSVEDAAAVLHLIVRKVPHRFPNVKFIVPHLGGPMPMLLPRLDGQLPWAHPDLPEPPSATARRFWYDTVAHGSKPAFKCACEAFGVDRMLTGSDYPFLPKAGYADAITYIQTSGIEKAAVDQIVNQNAAKLFKLA